MSPDLIRAASRDELAATMLLGRDVVAWINDRHDHDRRTYEEIRDELAERTGVRVTLRTIGNWRAARVEQQTPAAPSAPSEPEDPADAAIREVNEWVAQQRALAG